MYCSYFGFSERPFTIAPNPKYLFMSDRHREALAHLVFGVGESGGFVLLTGEVGTGKTTVCRCLLEQLPENTDIAFILNPKLTAIELLQTLCDDLELDYGADEPSFQPTMKTLNDVLNRHLLKAHGEGRHTVLLIDEAQNLSTDVLEQIRLLTNLETNEKKLLQIILIGQPELKTMLLQNELRQLSQRITARYHLEPLDLNETTGYINYRLAVAGNDNNIFATQAVLVTHKLSQGIPRIINTICDRALLGAYSRGKKVVDAPLIKQAAREVLGKKGLTKNDYHLQENRKKFLAEFSLKQLLLWLILIAIGMMSGWYISRQNILEPPTNKHSSLQLNLASNQIDTIEQQEQIPEKNKIPDGGDRFLTKLANFSFSYAQAIPSLAKIWGVDNVKDCLDLQRLHYRCELLQGSWGQMLAYDRPAMLSVMINGERKYILIYKASATDAQLVSLNNSNSKQIFSRLQLESVWSGEYSFIWLPPKGFNKTIKRGDSGILVQWLEQQLLHITQPELSRDSIIPTTIRFDSALEKQLQNFQKKYGLNADGIAGMRTIMLINQLVNPNIPRLSIMDKMTTVTPAVIEPSDLPEPEVSTKEEQNVTHP
ncbi:MAG TPA: AAA family ATPase [Aeromonadales bacterium]|nr:AAA family ATPase [Aeromonadales bacterium]